MQKLRLAISEICFVLLILALGFFAYGWILWPQIGYIYSSLNAIAMVMLLIAGYRYHKKRD